MEAHGSNGIGFGIECIKGIALRSSYGRGLGKFGEGPKIELSSRLETTINQEKNAKITASRETMEQQVRTIRGAIRLTAVLLPPPTRETE